MFNSELNDFHVIYMYSEFIQPVVCILHTKIHWDSKKSEGERTKTEGIRVLDVGDGEQEVSDVVDKRERKCRMIIKGVDRIDQQGDT